MNNTNCALRDRDLAEMRCVIDKGIQSMYLVSPQKGALSKTLLMRRRSLSQVPQGISKISN